MVLLTITPNILSALETLSPSSRNELSLPPEPTLGAPISHSQLITLSRHLTKANKRSPYQASCSKNKDGPDSNHSMGYGLDCLLRGTDIYLPPPPPKPEPSPEYLALKSRLQAVAEANAYNNLLQAGPVSGAPHQPSLLSKSSHPRISPPKLNHNGDFEDEDHLTPSLVLNILLSILLTGFSTYWAISHFRLPAFLLFIFSSPSASTSASRLAHETYPGSRSSGPARVFISLAAAVVVGVAEVVIYMAYLRKVRIAKEKEERIVERKKVGFIVDEKIEGKQEKVGVGMNEEIWGRGANGGVRRRVREKWEDNYKERMEGLD